MWAISESLYGSITVLAKQSSIAKEMHCCTGSFTIFLPGSIAEPDRCGGLRPAGDPRAPAIFRPDQVLLHEARNLIAMVGLYCDLLGAPGVLQLAHRKYAEDLRLVGARSEALLERLEQLKHRAAEGSGLAHSGPAASGSIAEGLVSC